MPPRPAAHPPAVTSPSCGAANELLPSRTHRQSQMIAIRMPTPCAGPYLTMIATEKPFSLFSLRMRCTTARW